jgi:chromate transport protein ChrA
MHYTIIAFVLYALTHLICGIFDQEFEDGGHIFIFACCVLWPLAIVVLLVIIICHMIAYSWHKIGEQIRKLFVNEKD